MQAKPIVFIVEFLFASFWDETTAFEHSTALLRKMPNRGGSVSFLHHLLELLAPYFMRRLQQCLGDPPNPGLVLAQLFVGTGAALISQRLALGRIFGSSALSKQLPHIAQVERCLGRTPWWREGVFRPETGEAKCNSPRDIDVHVFVAGAIDVAAFILKVEVDTAHSHAEGPRDNGMACFVEGHLPHDVKIRSEPHGLHSLRCAATATAR
jgi:hypothetical protein